MPASWERAYRWAVAEKAAAKRCSVCSVVSAHYAVCSQCHECTCKSCLLVDKHTLWDVGHVCAGCIVDLLDWFKEGEEGDDQHVDDLTADETNVVAGADCLLALADDVVGTQAAALAASTWSGYQ
eukprot:410998-Rhodomonas_salina.1